MTDRRDRLQAAGEWLAAARAEARLTQKRLAELLGISGAHVSNYERGISAFPDEATKRLADALGLDELDVRRGLGMYVPGEYLTEIDVPSAILRDPRLIPEARQHLLKQYRLLLRVDSAPGDEEEERARQRAEVQAKGAAILDEVANRRAAERGQRGPRRPK